MMQRVGNGHSEPLYGKNIELEELYRKLTGSYDISIVNRICDKIEILFNRKSDIDFSKLQSFVSGIVSYNVHFNERGNVNCIHFISTNGMYGDTLCINGTGLYFQMLGSENKKKSWWLFKW